MTPSPEYPKIELYLEDSPGIGFVSIDEAVFGVIAPGLHYIFAIDDIDTEGRTVHIGGFVLP